MSTEHKNKLGEEMTNAVEDVKEYFNLRMQLIQINITEKVSIALSHLISTGAAVIFYLLFFIFGSFALAYLLGNVFHNTAAGFAAMSGFYLVLALCIQWFGNKSLRSKLINLFIKEFSNDDKDE